MLRSVDTSRRPVTGTAACRHICRLDTAALPIHILSFQSQILQHGTPPSPSPPNAQHITLSVLGPTFHLLHSSILLPHNFFTHTTCPNAVQILLEPVKALCKRFALFAHLILEMKTPILQTRLLIGIFLGPFGSDPVVTLPAKDRQHHFRLKIEIFVVFILQHKGRMLSPLEGAVRQSVDFNHVRCFLLKCPSRYKCIAIWETVLV